MIMAYNKISLINFPDKSIFTGGDKDRDDYIPNPSEYSVQESDIDLNSKRSTSGVLNRNRIRVDTYSVTCSWNKLTEHQVDLLRYASCEAKFKLTFRHNQIDKSTGRVTSRFTTANEMYCDANRTFDLISTEDDEHDYWSVSLTFIQY